MAVYGEFTSDDTVGNYIAPPRPGYGGGYENLNPFELLANGDEANVEITTSCVNCGVELGVDWLPRAELELHGWDVWIAEKIGFHLCLTCKGEYPEGAKAKYGYHRLVVQVEFVPKVDVPKTEAERGMAAARYVCSLPQSTPNKVFHDKLDETVPPELFDGADMHDPEVVRQLHEVADQVGLDYRNTGPAEGELGFSFVPMVARIKARLGQALFPSKE